MENVVLSNKEREGFNCYGLDMTPLLSAFPELKHHTRGTYIVSLTTLYPFVTSE